jgi:hypothetical protein
VLKKNLEARCPLERFERLERFELLLRSETIARNEAHQALLAARWHTNIAGD